MTDTDWRRVEAMIDRSVKAAVKQTVNGKLDRIEAKLDPENENYLLGPVEEHMSQVKPFLEGFAGVRLLGGALKWVAGLAIAWLAIKSFFFGNSV